MALLGLRRKALGLAVRELLVGRHRDAVEVHGSVGWDADPERVADTAEQQAPEFCWLKLYAGTGTLEEDLDRIAAARRRIGDGHPFLLDVNGLWTPLQAIAAAPVLRELGVAAVEQPVTAGDDAGQARVAAVYAEQHGIGVIADERVRCAADAHTVAFSGAAQCVNVGVSKMGGIVAAFDAATTARSAFLEVSVGSVVELGVATAAGLQLAAALPEVSYPSYLIGSRKYQRQITAGPLEVVDSELAIGSEPGLGVEVDEEAVAAMDLSS